MQPPEQAAGAGEAPRAPAGRSRRRAALVLFACWAAVTAAELLVGLRPWVSAALVLLEALAVPLFVVIALRLHHDGLSPATDPRSVAAGACRHTAPRLARWRSYLVQAAALVVLVACLAGQVLVLLHARRAGVLPHQAASFQSYAVTAFVAVALGLAGSPRRLTDVVATMADHPARLMAGSFGSAVLIGGLALALPVALQRVEDASLLDALFTATSAVCVTGLAVNNVAETYSLFGQTVILLLMQVGGLGIMSLSTFFAVLAGRRLRAQRAAAMAELLDVASFSQLRRDLYRIVAFTLGVELLGAALLYLAFGAYPEVALGPDASSAPLAGAGGRLWAASFHAVSAFCNGGFSVFRGGLLPFAGSWSVSLIVAALIITGGIGFPVAFELLGRAGQWLRRQRRPRMSLHSRTVLWTTAALLGTGTLAMLLLEPFGSMRQLGWGDRLLTALFQSVTARTAGFSTLDTASLLPASQFVICLLMFVGASPGSTGGGVKTTTLAVLLSTLRAEMRRRPPEIGDRAIGADTVRRATAVTFVSVIIVCTALLLMLIVEPHRPMQLIFEVLSAFSTTGLSTGITGSLGAAGKLIITATMFIGRIGPLTLAVAMANTHASRRYRLVQERIAIG